LDRCKHGLDGKGVAGIVAFLLAANAQSVFAQVSPAPQGQDTGGIVEVIVTAQKQRENAQDVPISIGVVSALTIEKQGIVNIDDLGSKVPNVQVLLPYGPQDPQFTIRGVNGTDFLPPQTSPIGVNVDGIFKSVPALQALQLYDIDHVEILKGPQGTTEGRNATGGSVDIFSVAPSFDNSGYVTAGVGNFSREEIKGAVNVAAIEKQLALRVAWTYTNVPGYINNPLPDAAYDGKLSGVRDFGLRLSTLWKPTDDASFLLRLHSDRSDPVNYGEYSIGLCCGGEGIPPGSFAGYTTSSGLSIPQSFYPPTGYLRQGLAYGDTAATDVHRRDIDSQGLALEANIQLSKSLKLTSITGYDQGQWDTNENDGGSPMSINEADLFSRVHAFQEELRLASSYPGSYNFILGALYSRESLFFRQSTAWTAYQPVIYTAPDGSTFNTCLATGFYGCDLYDAFDQMRNDRALYLNNIYKFSDALKLTAGARYTDYTIAIHNYQEQVSYIDNTNNNNIVSFDGYPGPGVTQPDQKLVNRKWIERVALDYHITPHSMLYGIYSTGFRGGAFNASAQGGPTNGVQPEELTDYEIGIKNDFFDHRLRANFGAFYYIYKNLQFAGLGANGLADETNISKSWSKGLEAELSARPMKDLVLNFNSGFLLATYGHGFIPNPLAGYNTPNQPATVDIAGRPVYASPHWSFGASADWTLFRSANGLAIDLYVDGNGVSKQYLNAAYSPISLEPGYALWNARLDLRLPASNVKFSMWTQNVFDRQYLTAIYDVNAILNYTYAQRANPRTFGATLTYSW